MPEPMKPADVPEHYADLGREALKALIPQIRLGRLDADDVARAILAPVITDVATSIRIRHATLQSAEADVDAWKLRAQQHRALLRRASTHLHSKCTAGRHDDWGSGYSCAACQLAEQIDAALAEPEGTAV